MQRRGIKRRITEEGKSVFVGNREASSCSAKSMLELHSDMTSDVGWWDFSFFFDWNAGSFHTFPPDLCSPAPAWTLCLLWMSLVKEFCKLHMCDGPVSHWRWRKMQMLLFIYILHSLNLTKGLDNTMLVPYKRKYSVGTLFLSVQIYLLYNATGMRGKTLLIVQGQLRVLMQHMETINY